MFGWAPNTPLFENEFLNHVRLMFRSYRNQSITYMANQLTRSCMMEILVLNRLKMRMTSQIAGKCKQNILEKCFRRNYVRSYVLLVNNVHVEGSALLKNGKEIDSTILNKSESVVTRTLLHCDESFNDESKFDNPVCNY